MPNLLYQYIDHWITDGFSIQDVRDILLEFLAVIAFIFLLIVIIFAMIKAPMLIGHGSIEMSIFVVFGLIHAVMNILDEFIWFTTEFYPIWKAIKDLFLLVGAIVMMVGFFRFFIFSARLFGSELEKGKELDDVDELEEAVEEVAETIVEKDDEFTEDKIIDEVVEEVIEETLEDVLEEAVDDTYEDAIEDLSEEVAEEVTTETSDAEITEEIIHETSEEEVTTEEDNSKLKLDYVETETPEIPIPTEEAIPSETTEASRIPETSDEDETEVVSEEAEENANEEAFEDLYKEENRDEEASKDEKD